MYRKLYERRVFYRLVSTPMPELRRLHQLLERNNIQYDLIELVEKEMVSRKEEPK